MEDWVHQSAFTEFVHELFPKPLPESDSVLLGGQGEYMEGENIALISDKHTLIMSLQIKYRAIQQRRVHFYEDRALWKENSLEAYQYQVRLVTHSLTSIQITYDALSPAPTCILSSPSTIMH